MLGNLDFITKAETLIAAIPTLGCMGRRFGVADSSPAFEADVVVIARRHAEFFQENVEVLLRLTESAASNAG